MSHSPEPWYVEAGTPSEVRIVGNGTILCRLCVSARTSLAQQVENAERIVACVNACRGTPTEKLANVVTTGGLDSLEGMQELARGKYVVTEPYSD
jgi:hypothetical protein